MIARPTALVLAALSFAACSSDPAPATDAGNTPADTGTDAGVLVTDTGAADTGAHDAGPADVPVAAPRCNVNGGESCFELPTVVLSVSAGADAGTTAPDFDCDAPAPSTTTGAFTISGVVRDFQSSVPVMGATVDVFAGLGYTGAALGTATSSALGAYTVTIPSGTTGPLSWRVRASGTLDTYLVNDTVDLAGANVTNSNRNSVAETTAGLLAGLLGQSRRDGTGIVAGEAIDCRRRDLIGAIATLSTTSSRGTNARPTFVPDAQVYYFSAANLPTSRNAATMTNVSSANGLYLAIQVPASTTATYYAQVWGFRTAAALAMGASGLSLISEQAIKVLPDVLLTVNHESLRTP